MVESKPVNARNIELELEDPAHPHTGSGDFNFQPYSPEGPSSVTNNQPLPPIPWKVFVLSIFLTISGLILIILGFVHDTRKSDPAGGLTFWLTGGLVCIPGIFYSVKLLIAWRSTDPEERLRILDDVPV